MGLREGLLALQSCPVSNRALDLLILNRISSLKSFNDISSVVVGKIGHGKIGYFMFFAAILRTPVILEFYLFYVIYVFYVFYPYLAYFTKPNLIWFCALLCSPWFKSPSVRLMSLVMRTIKCIILQVIIIVKW